MSDLVKRLTAASAGTETWQVQHRESGGIVVWFTFADTSAPQGAAKRWLAEHMETNPDRWKDYEVAHVMATDSDDELMREAAAELERLQAEVERLRKDAERYRHMRASAGFQDRNGPGLYWYLPRFPNHLPVGARLDAAIDAAIREKFGLPAKE